MSCQVACGDCIEWLSGLDDDCADLMVTSPFYEDCRSYGMGNGKLPSGQAWVDYMVRVVKAAAPKVKGLIAIVCEGKTRQYRYSCTPFLLIADLHRLGFNLRKPVAYRRFGIMGSGGPDWLRNDWEPVICISRPGRLPWSDNVACGSPPKYGPGGVPSHRLADGTRVNEKRMREMVSAGGISQREAARQAGVPFKTTTSGTDDSGTTTQKTYIPPKLANPGNVITCSVGGGKMGHKLAHDNEAPFPLPLPEFFVRSFCPPGGLVIDPFLGSGTTAHAAIKWGRRFAGCDIRQSQVDLCNRRMADVMAKLQESGADHDHRHQEAK